MKNMITTPMKVKKQKSLFILLLFLFPLLLSANELTPGEIVKSMYDLILAGEYKESLLLDAQHSTKDFSNYNFDRGAESLKEAHRKLKKVNIISEDYLNANTATVTTEFINYGGATYIGKFHFIKENKIWKSNPKKFTSAPQKKQEPKEIVKPIIDLIVEGKYKDAARLEKQYITSDRITLTIDEIAKKYQEEYSGKLNGLKRYDMSQKNTKTRSGRKSTTTSLVTVYFVFENGIETDAKYHLIENEDYKWRIDPKKTTTEWNIDPAKRSKTKNTQGGFNTELYDIHLSESAPKLTDIINFHLSAYTVEVLTFIILGLSIIMHLLRRFRDEDEGFEGLQLPLFGILFVSVCVMELIIAMSGINPIWFCSPNTIGWFLSVIGFFAFVYILNNQMKSFRILMNEITVEPGFHSYGLLAKKYLTGIISGIIGIFILCFCAFLETGLIKTAFWTTAGIMALLQILQTVIIYKNMKTHAEYLGLIKAESEKRKLMLKKSMISAVYLIGAFATIVTLMYFMALFFVALVIIFVWIVLFIMGKVQSGSRSRSNNDDEEITIYNSDGSWEKAKRIPHKAAYEGKESGREYWEKDL